MKEKNRNPNETPQLAQVDIGALLTNQREGMRVSIDTVARTIKLSKGIIEHLENNRFSEIGTAVYVRGYLSLYAKYLGLDAAQMIHLYDSQYPSEPIAIRPALTQVKGKVQQKKRHSKTLSLLISAAVLGGLLYGYYRVEPLLFDQTTADKVEPTNVGEAGSAVNAVINEADGVQDLVDDALKGQPISSEVNNELASEIDLDRIELESVLDSLSDTTTGRSDATTEAVADTSAAVATAENQEANDKAVSDSVPLKITFRADCWLKITDANKKVLASNTYSTKRSVNAEGKPPFTLITARASAIKTVTFNQKVVKLSDYRRSSRRYEIK